MEYAYVDHSAAGAKAAEGEQGDTAIVTYRSTNYFTRSYAKEYDRFAIFSPSSLHSTVRHRGNVIVQGTPDLTPAEESVMLYVVDWVMPLAAAAVVLFVIDIIVRKIKWADIKSLFSKKSKGGKSA